MPFVPLADFIRGKRPAARGRWCETFFLGAQGKTLCRDAPKSRSAKSRKGRGGKASDTRSYYQRSDLGGQYHEECMRARPRKARGGKASDTWQCYRRNDLGGQYYEECMRASDMKRPPVLHVPGDYELTLYKVDMVRERNCE